MANEVERACMDLIHRLNDATSHVEDVAAVAHSLEVNADTSELAVEDALATLGNHVDGIVNSYHRAREAVFRHTDSVLSARS